ncbi:hypothetical protein [Bosea lathyri]|uniref:Uncharacterized protein n=1 Tax=Bosea lathyri TaxID=1036778 RepID=A0A1H6BUR0_9HYPH|nr:hypothetical protein [Bosea lathyri]SEG64390.1 hypothetical protein SAMN04488115_10891 [Bosea lathyri]
MDYFHQIEDKAVILRSGGVFRQAKVYKRGQMLFAGYGAGFVRLLKMPGTSNPNVSWEETDAAHSTDNLGRPIVS